MVLRSLHSNFQSMSMSWIYLWIIDLAISRQDLNHNCRDQGVTLICWLKLLLESLNTGWMMHKASIYNFSISIICLLAWLFFLGTLENNEHWLLESMNTEWMMHNACICNFSISIFCLSAGFFSWRLCKAMNFDCFFWCWVLHIKDVKIFD